MFERLQELYQRNAVFATFAVGLTFAVIAYGALNVSLFAHQVRQFFGGQNYLYGTTISVAGTAKREVQPDTARFMVTVTEKGATSEAASDLVGAKVKRVVDYLKENGVKDEDIDTESISTYQTWAPMPECLAWPCPEPTVSGYESSQMITVKTALKEEGDDNINELWDGVNSFKVAWVGSIEKGVDNVDDLRDEIKAEAIGDAREKAKKLADALGLSINRVTGFYEDQYYGGYGYEGGYGGTMYDMAQAKNSFIPIGEEEIVVTVNVSFELR
jgi:uncharacterized protein YggE